MQKFLRSFVIALGVSLLSFPVFGNETAPRDVVYVDNKAGSDDFTGRAPQPGAGNAGPYATIMQAVRKCQPGARIEVANTGIDYRESVQIEGYKKGRPDSPLYLDGHGAYVSGLVVVPAERWRQWKDDIYYFLNDTGETDKAGKPVYKKMPKSNWLLFKKHQGWFNEEEAPRIFFLNGQPGPNALQIEEIEPGGFFYDTQKTTLPEQKEQRVLFFRLPKGAKLADCRIEMPLNDGIYVSDDYVTVANFGSRYSRDDGFSGFWGHGVVLRNIHACFNCDQGVSFHGNSTTTIDGALIERNGGCGIVDVMSCSTIYRNVTVRNNYPGGVLLQGFAHSMFNSRIVNNRDGQVTVGKNSAGFLSNCLIAGQPGKSGGAAVSLGFGRLDHCTILNSRTGIYFEGPGQVGNSVIAGCQTKFSVGKDAQSRVAFTKTLVEPGEVLLDKQRLNAAAEGDFAAAFPGVIVDTPALEEPLYGFPKDSPYLKAASDGKQLGAQLPPFAEWTGKD